jgi:hypothetical protein
MDEVLVMKFLYSTIRVSTRVKAHHGCINGGKNRCTRSTTHVQFLSLQIRSLLIKSIDFWVDFKKII